jgi:tetratricopeptide (TPR) repeat protein
VSFKYNLRRKGMVKDTIHTTIIDTLYARGVELLDQRQYKEALNILQAYEDRNTAVAMLSLGFDEQAYRVLMRLKEDATVAYLRAIACARLQKIDEGQKHFKRACELHPTFEYRGRLDPEINILINSE